MSPDPSNDTALEPFRIEVDERVLADLRTRLAATRWPGGIEGAGWHYGAPQDEVRELCAYWAEEYDWRPTEARLNGYPQFRTDIDGETVHALHVRSPHPDAIPVVMTHGWPGSVVEFLDVIDPLVDPPNHGGDARDAVDLVVPSLPGYGFSGPTRTTGVHVRRVAEMWAELMARLGYDRYVAQGGDWGASVSSHLAQVDAEHVLGVHLNMMPTRPTKDQIAEATPEELAMLERGRRFNADGTGYSAIQGTRPQTLAYGLSDSPAGLAAWIYEKFRQWSDDVGPKGTPFTLEQICDNLTVYWVTGTINSSCRLYFETKQAGYWSHFPGRVEVPTGCSNFPAEIFPVTRAWAENRYDVTWWRDHDSGGHFAALQRPDAIVADVREFVATLR